jgi:hypothetical protein
MDIEDPTIRSFLAQFEPDGADYCYRSAIALDPVRVTAAERQAFLDDYARGVPGLIWILLGGILVSTLFMLADISILHVPYGLEFDIAAFGGSFLGWGYFSHRLMNAPERALRQRIPPRERLRWFERHKRMLADKSWWRIAREAAFIIVWLALITGRNQKTSYDFVLIVFFGLLLMFFVFNVALKLSLGPAQK